MGVKVKDFNNKLKVAMNVEERGRATKGREKPKKPNVSHRSTKKPAN